MPTFTGTERHDVITPDEVSPGVLATGEPAPSDARDLVFGNRGNDTIATAGGSDTVGGGGGDDEISLGAGDDFAAWTSADGSDTIEGGDGYDQLGMAGDARRENYSIFDGFLGASVFRDLGLVSLTTSGVERLEIELQGNNDSVQISDLSSTDLREILLDYGVGGRDELSLIGTGGADAVTFEATGDGFVVHALGADTTVLGFGGRDAVIVSLGAGNDSVDARGLGAMNLVVAAGEGDDIGYLGGGDDRWGTVGTPGNDTVDAGAGRDTFDLDASIANDVIVLAGSGAEATARHAGSTVLLRNFERIEVESASGDDLVDGSGITSDLHLDIEGGAGADTIIGGARGDVLNGGAGDDVLTGGGGRDRFVFGAESANGVRDYDVVTDFGLHDTLDLTALTGGYVAEATAEGLLLSFTGGDGDQVLLRGATTGAEYDILGG